MAEYEKEFSHLSKYSPELVLTEAFLCRQFDDGLHDSIKRYLAPMTSLQQVNFYQLVQATMKVERLETSNKERSQKKFSKGASSSSRKRARESPTQSECSLATRGRIQGSNVSPSSGRGALVRQGEIPEYPHYYRRHLGICRLLTGVCFQCGSTDHLIAQCPKKSEDNRSLQESCRGKSVTLPSTRDQRRGRGGLIQHRGRGA